MVPLIARYAAGMFAFQSNSASREFEYPWAWHEADVRPGMTCVDVGAGHSGFPFVLSTAGADVTLVDPFLQYSADRSYQKSPALVVARMNRAFRTRVRVVHGTMEHAQLADTSVDRIFCISALEHMPDEAIATIATEAERVLKPGARLILTVDLFLDIAPFAAPEHNQFGRNIDIRRFVEATRLNLVVGRPAELHGYPEFRADRIRAQQQDYMVSASYPLLTQCLVLAKPGPVG
jgi:SAM-dependent methyltransferase